MPLRRPFAALVVLGIGAVAAAPPVAPGRLDGVVTLSSRLTRARPRVRIYDEPGARAAPAQADDSPLANLVLYLDSVPPPAGEQARGGAVVMRQRGERFVPHVLPVLVGTTVEFPNDDPIYHNVFSLSRARTFDLGRYPQGHAKTVRFQTPGVVQVFCHIHADMSGFILVLDNPHFTVPDATGRYALEDIPPGEYRLVAWHERIRPVTTAVRIASGSATRVDLHIPLADPER
jgi:plastocyanin